MANWRNRISIREEMRGYQDDFRLMDTADELERPVGLLQPGHVFAEEVDGKKNADDTGIGTQTGECREPGQAQRRGEQAVGTEMAALRITLRSGGSGSKACSPVPPGAHQAARLSEGGGRRIASSG